MAKELAYAHRIAMYDMSNYSPLEEGEYNNLLHLVEESIEVESFDFDF